MSSEAALVTFTPQGSTKEKELKMLIYDVQEVRMPRSAGMHESGLLGELDRLFPTRSTSPIHGLVRFFVSFCLAIICLITHSEAPLQAMKS